MATTSYAQNRTRTLNDLISSGPVAQDGGVQQQESTQGVDPYSAERKTLLQTISEPDNFGPEPTVDKPSLLAKLLLGGGDALKAYASVLGRVPLRTDSLEKYMEYLAGQKESKAKYDELKSLSESRSKRTTAQYLLGEVDRREAKSERSLAATERKAEREAAIIRDKEARAQVSAEKQAAMAAQAEAAAKEMAWKDRMASAERRHEESLVKLRSQQEGGSKTAKDQLEGLSTAKAGVNQIANNLPKLIQGYADQAGEHPGMKPDEIETMFRRSLAELNLDRDATAAAQAYFDQEVASQFQRLAGGGASGQW